MEVIKKRIQIRRWRRWKSNGLSQKPRIWAEWTRKARKKKTNWSLKEKPRRIRYHRNKRRKQRKPRPKMKEKKSFIIVFLY